MQQSERGRTNGKLFLADGKLPRALRESGCWAEPSSACYIDVLS